jgi:hypothetical protein
MRFPFKVVMDGQGFTAPRPVFQFVVQGSTRNRPCYCLLDTGTSDVLVMTDLATDAGIDLTGLRPSWGKPSTWAAGPGLGSVLGSFIHVRGRSPVVTRIVFARLADRGGRR